MHTLLLDRPEHALERRAQANAVWSMDFVLDRTAACRVIKCLTIVDDATHEAVAIETERAISSHGVVRVLERLALSWGLPKVIRSDNGKDSAGEPWSRGFTGAASYYA